MSPSITKMIRMDHSHAMMAFHKYDVNASASKKQAVVKTVLLALEIHAQLEEEIFYPALQEVAPDNEALKKARPEHDEMKRLIAQLRTMSPEDGAYDSTFMELMRDVVHHVADEETVMLPAAERLLKDRLGELGAKMTARRLQLAAPHAGEIVANGVRAMPATTVLMGAALVGAGWLLARALRPDGYRSHWRY
ncbi:MAG: hemerythrin domain-containing protein [Oxalobacteraceae bacterium]|nr:MAG: hemerythrin domain-containing protein [Oxalobacteraceae bacterium]